MLTRISLVLSYILWCCRFLVAPWKYFQLNANYFNQDLHIFSKLDMDLLIPEQWRLSQFVDQGEDTGAKQPEAYPVFLKPEWGQNSQGVSRIDSQEALQQHRANRPNVGPRYLIQAAAKGKREFEIFFIPGATTDHSSAIISVTETCNHSDDEMPVNGIYNRDTYYQSCMPQLSAEQIAKLESLFSKIGSFRIARFCARADSLEALLNEQFSIVEINVYVPMPLILLTQDMPLRCKFKFIFASMKQLALVTKGIPASQPVKSIFFQKLQSARLLKSKLKNELS
ncbi:hypothetical protein DS885_07950 [Psychromonas sp. B3M02]|uniref:hypothetical protein n=1 Tax=Psychromonas sp. B3M02 TaxID=2267226 RepID=UPI000DE8BA0C|nr:hypothetical protein [Psychromonas sp. B3M02]RBW46502.1 hypothetical protein DS885_07950 [Psychromonas sp. B3M02]